MIVYLNGSFLPIAEARIPITDRGFLYGDALYETVRVQGSGYVRFDEHYRRLLRGAQALAIPVPDAETLRRIGGELAARNGVFDGAMRVTLTRGPGGEGLASREAGPPTVVVTLAPIPEARLRRAEAGWTAIVARARRAPAAIKSAHRVDAILAKLEAEAAGADEAILLTPDGWVAEGTICNVFWRRGDTWYTPALDLGILPGVTRGLVLELAAREGLPVEEGRYPADALRAADAVIVTMTSLGIVHVRALDGRALPTSGPRGGLARLRDAYAGLVAADAARDPLPLPEGVERGARRT